MIYTIDYIVPSYARVTVDADNDAEAYAKVQEIIEGPDGDEYPFEIDWDAEAEYDIVDVE